MEKKDFFQDGDILWSQKCGGIVISGQTAEGLPQVGQIEVASPIVLDDDILQNVLGFTKNSYGEYVYNGICIKPNQMNNRAPFSFEGNSISYLNEIQHIAKENGVELNPNLQKLRELYTC